MNTYQPPETLVHVFIELHIQRGKFLKSLYVQRFYVVQVIYLLSVSNYSIINHSA